MCKRVQAAAVFVEIYGGSAVCAEAVPGRTPGTLPAHAVAPRLGYRAGQTWADSWQVLDGAEVRGPGGLPLLSHLSTGSGHRAGTGIQVLFLLI